MKKLLISSVLTMGLASAASAGSVDWAFSVDGDWTSENGSFFSTFTQDTLAWGLPKKSTMTFDDNTPGPGTSGTLAIGATDTIDILSIDWYNASSFALATPDAFQATANIDLDWLAPPPGQNGNVDVSFDINNALNPDGDDASLNVIAGTLGAPFRIGNLVVESYSLVEVGDGTFDGTNWFNPEHGHSSLVLKANVAAVPLPAAGWMLLAGVGGLVAMKRRRKAEAA